MKTFFKYFACLLVAVLCFGQVWGAADVTYDFTGSGWTVSNGTLSNGTVSFTGAGSANFKMSSGYFMFGKSGAYIDFPTYAKAVAKIVVTGRSGASASTGMNIYVGETAVSTATTGSTGTNTYEIAAASQAAGTTYTLKVTSNHNAQITKIEIYYKAETPAGTCVAPTFSPAAGAVLSGTTVTLSTTTASADIYYTMGASPADPTTSSSKYTAPISITEATTIKAIAAKSGLSNSSVVSASYTIITPLTTMQDIFDAATTTETAKTITFNSAWVVSGVKSDGKQAYLTDGTKGLILYSSSNMGLAVGNTLSGTKECTLVLYNGAAELKNFNTTGLTKGTGGIVTPVVLDAYGITALSGVNTGSVIKISGTATQDGTKYYVAGVQVYNTLCTDYTNPTAGKNYNCTGVYLQFNNTKEILPRSAADIEEIVDPGKVATPTFSPEAGEFDAAQSVTISCSTDEAIIYYTIDGTDPTTSSSVYSTAIAVSETTTIKAFAVKSGLSNSDIASATFTITIGGGDDPGNTVTFDYADYKGQGTSSSGSNYTMVKTDIVSIGDTKFYGNNSYAHFYAGGETTITPASRVTITQIVLTASTDNYNGYQSEGVVTASAGSLSHEGVVVTWTGSADAAFTISHNKQIRWTSIVVTYETADPSAPTLAVDPNVIDFGDVEQGESVSAKTVAVNFANLTGAVTFSGLSSPFSASGSISTTGDEITISADATVEIGEYEQTLTVTSADDSKSATVTVTMNVVAPETGEQFVKVTATPAEGNWSGDYLLVYESGTTAYVWDGTDDAEKCKTATIKSGNKIAKPDGAAVVVIEAITGGHSLQISGGSNDGKYIVDNANNAALKFGDAAYAATITYETNWTKILFSQRCIRYNSSSGQDRFRYYADNGQQPVQLYKAVNSKSPAGLAWSTDAVELTVGDEFTAPTLSNPNSIAANEIAISSNNTNLATVSNGVVSLVADATGTATITATFNGNDNYKPATISYTITVSSTTPTTDNVVILATYGTKLYAMSTTLSSSAFTAIEVEEDGSNIVVPSAEAKDAIQWTRVTRGENTTFQDADSKYMAGGTGNTNMSLADDPCNWSWNATDSYYYIGSRSFFYNKSNIFKNYSTSNAGGDDYSDFAEVRVIAAENIVVTSKADPQLAYSPTSVELTVGGTFTPATLTYASGFDGLAAVTYESSNTNLATVEGGVVSLVADATGTATITASFAGNNNYLSGSASYTIKVNEVQEDLPDAWVLVTNTNQIESDMSVIIASEIVDGNIYTMGAQNSNNRAGVESSVDVNGVLTPGEGTEIFKLTNVGNKCFAIQASNNNCLYAASSSSNQLKEEATPDSNNNYKWSISIGNDTALILAQGKATRNLMRFNPNNGNPIFSCYENKTDPTGYAVALYIPKVEEDPDPQPEDLVYTEVRSGLEIGRHYTACLKKKIVAVKGATIWGLRYRNDAGTIAYLEQAQLPLAAGTPFIYQATDAIFEASYEGADAKQPIESGALRGTFEDMDAEALEGVEGTIYMMYQNALRPLGTNNHLDAFRAYLLVDAMTVPNETPQDTPGRHVRSMSMQGNVATGIEDTESAAQAMKVMIDGQLFIQRGEKLYDVTGQMVK